MLGIIIVVGWLALCLVFQAVGNSISSKKAERKRKQCAHIEKRNAYYNALWDDSVDFSGGAYTSRRSEAGCSSSFARKSA